MDWGAWCTLIWAIGAWDGMMVTGWLDSRVWVEMEAFHLNDGKEMLDGLY